MHRLSENRERLGAHVSVQGGVHTAPGRGIDIGATAIQIFTKTPNQWREPRIEAPTRDDFRRAYGQSGLRCIVAHDSYLINLASPDPVLNARSVESFTLELARCKYLGVEAVVSHPGNYIDDRALGLDRNARGILHALKAVPGNVMVLLETTAGTGTVLGSTFEELAALRDRIPKRYRRRIGFCADTCHLYSAGYDLVGDFDGVWSEWDRVVGLEHLRCLHLNDSKTAFASHRDRHELIGEGSLGHTPFSRIMNDPRFTDIPKILETPKGDDDLVTNDRVMLARLREYTTAPR